MPTTDPKDPFGDEMDEDSRAKFDALFDAITRQQREIDSMGDRMVTMLEIVSGLLTVVRTHITDPNGHNDVADG